MRIIKKDKIKLNKNKFGQNEVSTIAPFCTFLRIRNRAKTIDAHFVQNFSTLKVVPLDEIKRKYETSGRCSPTEL